MAKKENMGKMEEYKNFMVPTANRPYLPINSVAGVGIKPMNVLDKPSVWSATLEIKKGHSLPTRKNTSLCELLVISGKGKYKSGYYFSQGDYIREEEGSYEQIFAESEIVVFITNHGSTTFIDGDDKPLWLADSKAISSLLENGQ